MKVIIENAQDSIKLESGMEELMTKAVEISLNNEEFKIPSEISILLTDDNGIREINREQRNIDKSTDVLSFPMTDIFKGKLESDTGDFNMDENLLMLGDIVISMETAKRQAEEYGHSFEREMAFLVTHGMFHLLGYDHADEKDEKEMMEKQEAVLEELGLARN